jgi:CBS domain-containing protein
MSPRAACRLEELGFSRVYDYVAGISDWKAAGLPIEGTATAESSERVADATRPDMPISEPEDPSLPALARLAEEEWEIAVVVDCDGVVVGLLRSGSSAEEGDLVADIMESGPSTVRPDGLLQPLVDRMDRRQVPTVLVTTPEGRLIGVLLLEEAKRLLAGEAPERIWIDCEGCPGRWGRSWGASPRGRLAGS